MNYDDQIKLEFWLHILWIAIAIIVAILLVVPDSHRLFALVGPIDAEAEYNYTEFYETSVANWMAPMGEEEKTIGIVTYYTNRPEETDSTPNITASGQGVRDGIVANNCLEFGTMVEIDGKMYEVQDRGAERHLCNWFDIFTFSYEEALIWGSRIKEITIYYPF